MHMQATMHAKCILKVYSKNVYQWRIHKIQTKSKTNDAYEHTYSSCIQKQTTNSCTNAIVYVDSQKCKEQMHTLILTQIHINIRVLHWSTQTLHISDAYQTCTLKMHTTTAHFKYYKRCKPLHVSVSRTLGKIENPKIWRPTDAITKHICGQKRERKHMTPKWCG